MEGERDVLGMWFQHTEGAKFWMQVLNELRHKAGSANPAPRAHVTR
jgi:transposase-like protein